MNQNNTTNITLVGITIHEFQKYQTTIIYFCTVKDEISKNTNKQTNASFTKTRKIYYLEQLHLTGLYVNNQLR